MNRMNHDDDLLERPELDTFNFRRPIAKVKAAVLRHKWVVFLTVLFMVGLVVAYMAIWPKTYQAKVLLYVEVDRDDSRDGFYSGWNVFRKDDKKSEVYLMKSGPVLTRVVEELGLKYDDVYHPFLTYAGHLWRESWLGKQYKQVKEHFFPPRKSDYALAPEQKELAKTVHDFRSGVSIGAVKNSNVGELVVKGPTPRVAEMANKLADVYLEARAQRHKTEAAEAFETLTEHVAEARAELETMENRVQGFSEENGVYFEFEKEKADVRNLAQLQNKIVDSRAEVATYETALAEVEKQLAEEDPERIRARTFSLNELRQAMKKMRLDQEAALLTLQHRYAPTSPEIEETESKIASLQGMIAETEALVEASHTTELNATFESLRQRRNELMASLAGARSGLAVLEEEAAEMGRRLESVPYKMETIASLKRDRKMAELKYVALLEKQSQAEVSMATVGDAMPSMRVVEYANPPGYHSWPKNKLLLAIALILGLGMGVGAAVLLELYSNRVRTDQFEMTVAELPVMGRIKVGGNGGSTLLRRNGDRPARAGQQTGGDLN